MQVTIHNETSVFWEKTWKGEMQQVFMGYAGWHCQISVSSKFSLLSREGNLVSCAIDRHSSFSHDKEHAIK